MSIRAIEDGWKRLLDGLRQRSSLRQRLIWQDRKATHETSGVCVVPPERRNRDGADSDNNASAQQGARETSIGSTHTSIDEQPATAAVSEAKQEPWRPQVMREAELNPFANPQQRQGSHRGARRADNTDDVGDGQDPEQPREHPSAASSV
jgi:hypothetical protein